MSHIGISLSAPAIHPSSGDIDCTEPVWTLIESLGGCSVSRPGGRMGGRNAGRGAGLAGQQVVQVLDDIVDVTGRQIGILVPRPFFWLKIMRMCVIFPGAH